ncbi:preprotein translocase subunit SecE, partial [Candidatus Microgenomates bacterium]|nr:preprotein translocase subunit SecE [Candidatus Microgenomates bacterium]
MKDFTITKPDFGKSPLDFFKEVKTELTKVSWPNRTAVVKLTAVVVGASVAVGVYLGGLDYIFT